MRAAREPSAFGSWRSLSANEDYRSSKTLHSSLEATKDLLQNTLATLEEAELADWEQSIVSSQKQILDNERPTEIGNPAYHSLLTDLIRDVEQATNRLGYEVPEEVIFGVLPTGRVNGLVCPVPAGGLIVAIDDGLFNFLYGLAKAVAMFYTVTVMNDGLNFTLADQDLPTAVQENEEANIRWTETLTATFIYGYPNYAPLHPLWGSRALLVSHLVTPLELFIVAHEYGHLVLGHCDDNRSTSKWRMSGSVDIEEYKTTQAEELEADRVGLEILREHQRHAGLTVDNTRWVICFWAGCLNILEEMLGQWPTHPSASTRTQCLLDHLAKEDEITSVTSTFGAGIYKVMRELRFYNRTRYEKWKATALSGSIPWSQS